MGLDLVTIWTLLLAFGLMVYVLLDGVYLGVGALLLGVRQPTDKVAMMQSLAPVCGANLVWLLLCSVALMVTFPTAYSVMLEAFNVPLLLMLAGLVLRGMGFKYQLSAAQNHQARGRLLFSMGSLLAAFCQGAMVGAILQGVTVDNHEYVGQAWEWLSWFSVLTGVSLVLAYALLGATWLLITIKEPMLYQTMRRYSHHLLVWLGYAVTCLQLIVPFLTEALRERWLGLPNFFYMGFVPMLGLMAFVWAYYVIRFSTWKVWPISIVLIFLGTIYFTLITCLWPAILPTQVTVHNAAAEHASLSLALWATIIVVAAMFAYLYRAYSAFYRVSVKRMALVSHRAASL